MSEVSRATRLAVGALATWRLAHLIAHEDGPSDVIVRSRARVGNAPLGTLIDCFYCLSFWVAAPIALATTPRRRDLATTWLALSGAACLLERVTNVSNEPAVQEGRHQADELLWPEAASA